MVIPPIVGGGLVLVGLALFLVDLSVTNHGLPTAGATLAFAPEEAYPEDSEPVLEVGHKAAVVGFGDRGVLQVVPVESPRRRSDLGPRD
jgi:hypothetical protein